MKRFGLYTLVFLLAISGGSLADEAVGKELGRIFRAAGDKIQAPAPKPLASRGAAAGLRGAGEAPAGGRDLTVSAFSYCLTGRTASGRYTEPGIVAVDPRVIPMGSKLYIPGYGWGVAADTGGAIKGNKIDVWLPSARQCFQWGVRTVKIKVFPPSHKR